MLMVLIMMKLSWLCNKNILARLKKRSVFALMCLVTKMDQKFEDSMGLLLLIDDNKSHYVYIKDLDRFMFHKTKSKNKYFCKSCLQYFSSKNVLTKHKEACLSINALQSVRLEKGTIDFKKIFKQIPFPFKIHVDFESNLKAVEIYEGFYSKNIKITFLVVLLTSLFVLMINFTKPIVVFRGKNAAYEFIKAILKEHEYCKKVMEKHFNKNLIMSEKEEGQFQSSNICWICEKLIDDDDEKARDHCHVTGKFRSTAHWNCNINL